MLRIFCDTRNYEVHQWKKETERERERQSERQQEIEWDKDNEYEARADTHTTAAVAMIVAVDFFHFTQPHIWLCRTGCLPTIISNFMHVGYFSHNFHSIIFVLFLVGSLFLPLCLALALTLTLCLCVVGLFYVIFCVVFFCLLFISELISI